MAAFRKNLSNYSPVVRQIDVGRTANLRPIAKSARKRHTQAEDIYGDEPKIFAS